MFSQYSWWDFAKFCLALAIPYYAYVLWTYYRHDIREWIANRGNKESQAPVEEPDDEPAESIYSVSNYVDPEFTPTVPAPQRPPVPAPASSAGPANTAAPAVQKEKVVATEWLPEPPKTPAPAPATVTPVAAVDAEEVDINAPAMNAEEQPVFGLSLDLTSDNPNEQSLDKLLLVAERIKPGANGAVEAVDKDDEPAVSLAAQINSQQDTDEFAGLRFTR